MSIRAIAGLSIVSDADGSYSDKNVVIGKAKPVMGKRQLRPRNRDSLAIVLVSILSHHNVVTAD